MAIYKDVELKDGGGNTIFPATKSASSATYSEATTAFMNKFAQKATSLLMTNTSSGSPSGIYGANSTAHDLLKLVVAALHYDQLNIIWSTKSKTITTKNSVSRTIVLNTTVHNAEFEAEYTLLAGKTGMVGSSYALIVVALCEGQLLAGAIIGASSESARFTAMKELFDIGKKALNGQSVASDSITNAQAGAICVVPRITSLYDSRELDVLFSQNANTVLGMGSVTKTLTAITALDYIEDLDEKITIVSQDVSVSGGSNFYANDITTYRDALYAMMLPSDNGAANAVASNVGRIILARQ